jgi:hypothetical protein
LDPFPVVLKAEDDSLELNLAVMIEGRSCTLHVIKRVCHRYDVQDEEKMLDCLKDIVRDTLLEVNTRHYVTSAHGLRREPLAVFVFIGNVYGSVERDEGKGSKEDLNGHVVAWALCRP